MPLLTTPAVVLHHYRYGETSKIVRLATRDLGVQSAIAKGALRPTSRFGARLQAMSGGTAQLVVKPHRELHTLTEFDVHTQRPALAHDVRRYAAAAALAEVVMLFVPAEPQPEIFDLVVGGLDELAAAEGGRLEASALAVLWSVVGALGFAPVLDRCVRDDRELPDGAAAFATAEGGLLCRVCAAGTGARMLPAADRQALEWFVHGEVGPGPELPLRHAASHRRLLRRFVERHVADGRELRAVRFWEAGP